MSNKGCTLFGEGVESRLKGGCSRAPKASRELYSVLCSRGGLLGRSPTLANLGNDHEFIIKEYISIGTRTFGEANQNHKSLCTQKWTISYHCGDP